MAVRSPASRRPWVLVVVEDPIVRELIGRMLHLAGFASLAAPTGERALLVLREQRHAVEWLVAGASLPGLVDAAILRDEFQSLHPGRAPLLLVPAGHPARVCGPTASSPAEVVEVLTRLATELPPGGAEETSRAA